MFFSFFDRELVQAVQRFSPSEAAAMDCEGAVKPNIFELLPVLALFVFLVVRFGFVFVGELRTNLVQTLCPT